jgi:hypothetical protein
MKKILVRCLIALVILVLLAFLAVGLFLDKAVKRGVETFGPALTQVSVKLDSVSLSLLSGSGKIKGLVIGNPAGYQTPSAINIGSASLALKPGSLLSDKIVIKSIDVEGPEITFETSLKGNNLKKIQANMQEATGGDQSSPAKELPGQTKPSKKLEVDDLVINGGRIHVSVTGLAGKSATVPLPPIHLTGLGKGPDGITPAELAKIILQSIEENTAQAAGSAVADLGKGALYFGNSATNGIEKVTRGLGDLFKKK